MECDHAWLLPQAGNTITDRHNKGKPATWAERPTHAVLVETPEGGILWDTGVPRDCEQRWAPTGFHDFFPVQEDPQGPGFLDSALADLGMTTEDIDVLALSYLHFDHAANAKMFDNGKARIIAQADEIEGVKTIDGYSKGAHIVSDFEGLNIEAVSGDVIAVDALPEKLELAREWGATATYTPQEVLDQGVKARCVIECAGNARAFETAEARTIIGSYLGSAVPARDIPKYAQLWREGKSPVERLVSPRIELADINAAMDELPDGKAIRQVIMFDSPDSENDDDEEQVA